jgi:hypothetical protein
MQAAVGGVDKISAIRDFDELSVADTFDPRGEPIRVQKRVRWVKPNHLRVDQLGPFDTYVLYFDGKDGWEILPDGKVAGLAGGELEFAKKYLADFFINILLADRLPGYTITSPARNVIRVAIYDDPNQQVEMTLDPGTHLPLKEVSISLGNPDRPMPIEYQNHEWTTIAGIRFAKNTWIVQNGRKLGEIVRQQIKINTGIRPQPLAVKPPDNKPVLYGQ